MSTKKGSVDIKEYFLIWDTSTKLPKTGLVYTDMTGSYLRNGGTRTNIVMATLGSVGAVHSDGGFIEVDATNMAGVYRFDPPDAVYSTGVDDVVLNLEATDCFAEPLRVDLVDYKALDIVENATYGLQVIKRYAANIFTAVFHLNGASWPAGTSFYWDPDGGNDSNDGLTPETAKLTYASALGLVTAFNHDSINIINSTGAALVIDIKVDLNKEHMHLKGNDGITIKPSSSGASTVILSANGTHLEGLSVETHTVGNDDAIEITGDECEVHGVKAPYSRASAIVLNGTNDSTVHSIILRTPGSGGNGHGISITGASTGNRIHDFDILGAAGDGINLNGAGVTENTISAGDGTSVIHECTGWGIREQGGADDNEIIGPSLLIEDNTAGDIELTGSTTVINITQYARFTDLPTNFADMVITVTTGLVDITQTAADKVWASAARTLTSFGTLMADIWAYATRTLTAGTKDTEIDAIKAVTDNLPDSGALNDLTTIEAKTTNLPADPASETSIAALNNISVANVTTGAETAIDNKLPSGETEIAAAGAVAKNLDEVTVDVGDITLKGYDMEGV